MKYFIAGIALIILIIGMLAYSVFSWGFVCFKFWSWFIHPIFPSLPILTFGQGIGLMFFISLFKNHNSQTNSNKEEKDKYTDTISFFVSPWLLFLLGYIFS